MGLQLLLNLPLFSSRLESVKFLSDCQTLIKLLFLEFLIFLLKLWDLDLHPLLRCTHLTLSAVYFVLKFGYQLFLAVYLGSNLREGFILGLGARLLAVGFHARHDSNDGGTSLLFKKWLGYGYALDLDTLFRLCELFFNAYKFKCAGQRARLRFEGLDLVRMFLVILNAMPCCQNRLLLCYNLVCIAIFEWRYAGCNIMCWLISSLWVQKDWSSFLCSHHLIWRIIGLHKPYWGRLECGLKFLLVVQFFGWRTLGHREARNWRPLPVLKLLIYVAMPLLQKCPGPSTSLQHSLHGPI